MVLFGLVLYVSVNSYGHDGTVSSPVHDNWSKEVEPQLKISKVATMFLLNMYFIISIDTTYEQMSRCVPYHSCSTKMQKYGHTSKNKLLSFSILILCNHA